jgi:hypothetical protein
MKKLILGLALFLLSAPVWAELEVIELRHRSAEELLPIVRPLLDKDDVASGMNNQLILRASPKRIAEIKKLLESLDTAPRRLKITVMQDVDSDTVARLTEVSGSVGVGRNARVTVPGSGDTGGLSVEAGRGQDKLRARGYSTRSIETDRKTQQLQVIEGNRALVRSGQSVPVPVRQVIQRPWGTEVIDSTEYKQVDSGFYVLPRISGDRVTLEISAQNDALAPGGTYPTTHTQQTSSTVSGRLGEWIAVGGIGRGGDTDSSTVSTRSAARSQEQRNVLIKVEEVE